ncbi:hypothetical protein [Clostridium tetani]|uniref:hypothetical protein n=1 Tax=Clostridium tetani TaxID=1513 RepID=UPI00100B8002|nr:hypothetical protein [Clostridium tetani]RXM57199.1 hypothetical protein DP133_11560 [Clostridium tetani]RXM70336.1 hypothetical protein DP139_06510 [Clostridium tetani]
MSNNNVKINLEEEVKIMSLEGSGILKNNLKDEKDNKKYYINKIYNINFNKSLLLNKLIDLGLNVSKMNTTRDIINVRFTYGYDKDTKKIEELEKQIDDLKLKNKDSVQADKKYNTKEVKLRRIGRKENRDTIKELKQQIKDLKLNKDDVREKIYKDGFFLDYYKVKKDENKRIVKDSEGNKVHILDERINYVYWFRTSAKARVGEVFFINKKLVDKINKWQQMGIEFNKDKECKLVEMEAYKALTASSLEGLVEINTRTEILVINDLDSFSTHKCKLVKVKNDKCYVEDDNSYKLKNTLFDGQGLLDVTIFNSNKLLKGKGMALLRNRFFKCCAFNTNIQLFFRNYCMENGLDYNTYTIKDRYGRELLAKNIKIITTENSMKWEKFDTTMENWITKIEDDNNLFGIVKTEHESKYGDLQRMSYQMLNTLDPNLVNMDNILQDTLDYTENIKNNIDGFMSYLNTTKNDMNINQMLIDLYNRNKNIVGTELFRDYKKYQIRDWKDRLKAGKLLIEGDNLTIVGNPYLMLLHAVGQVKHVNNVIDSSFIDIALGQGNTCYTTRFTENEELACFRNPHNAPNNIYHAKNTRNKLMYTYFNFTENIIACNLINTDFQDRLNGSDQDSDFALVTNQKDIVNFAKYTKENYPTIVNCIPKDKKPYQNNMKNMADIDNTLAKSKSDIGITSNIAQIALSWYMDTKDKELADVVCICSVLAQVAIDNAKRKYAVNLQEQIRNINKLECMDVKVNNKNAKPSFWKYTSDSFKKEDKRKLLKVNCFMCLLEGRINKINDSKKIDNVDILQLLDKKISNKYKHEQIQSIIDKYKEFKKTDNYLINKIRNTRNKEYKAILVQQQKDNLININDKIGKMKINEKNMKALIKKFADKKNKDLDTDFLQLLYKNKKETFLEVFVEDEKGVKQKLKSLVG